MIVLVTYHFVTDYPKMEQLKIANIYYLAVSVDEEAGSGLTGCLGSGSPTRLQSRCQQSSQGL